MQSPADRFYPSNSSDILERNMEDCGHFSCRRNTFPILFWMKEWRLKLL